VQDKLSSFNEPHKNRSSLPRVDLAQLRRLATCDTSVGVDVGENHLLLLKGLEPVYPDVTRVLAQRTVDGRAQVVCPRATLPSCI
jgi:hypothetical protein